ncbi:MAG: 4Fe-4S dicluster domain-containing protein [Bacteroidetes bacterium]|nr:4Fe-4S dicluster domain-containing protein [Bacteroidota bacterium]
MIKQVIFALTLLSTLCVFTFTIYRIFQFFKLTRPGFPVKNFGRRFVIMFDVAFGQTKIFRRPFIGLLHALVFWGFCVIAFGSIEMVIDGFSGTDRALHFLGPVYDLVSASGDIFGLIVAICILVFLARRLFFHIKRFEGIEMKVVSHLDANIALTMILLLMVSLLGMNSAYCAGVAQSPVQIAGFYPVSAIIGVSLSRLTLEQISVIYEICWWSHILLIFLFVNILPYSKHFHVFMSIPNVFLSRLEPLGKLTNMDNITHEVKMMLNPNISLPEPSAENLSDRFGVKDVEDITWKNYLDSLSCTECGRCSSVCPANITGKRLSPRKIIMDVRARMKEKGPGLIQKGKNYSDKKSLLRNYISEEELWACTTCNACAMECPININHPTLIIDMRRYLVMEEASAPGELKAVFNNIENNGAPWQFSAEDRLMWTQNLEMNIY